MQILSLNFRAQGLLDATGRIIITLDPSGIVLLVSKLAREHLDLVPGTPLEAEYPGFWLQVNKVFEGALSSCEIPMQLGAREYLVGINPLMEEGKTKGAVCVLVDSTQLDTMTRRLPSFNTLSRQLDTIIDSSSDGLFVCDSNANVIRMNPASEKIHNLPASDIIGRNMRELIESGFIDRSAALEATIKKERVSQLQNKDGRKLISIATPVFDDNGSLVRVVVSERDITEIDNLQRELEKQEGMRDGFREQMLAMQQTELEAQQIIARSPAMLNAIQQAMKVAKADSSVLLLGESGVGKGLFADMIHKHSQRSSDPLIKINCGAIPESLIEAELFGYEKGAFTGALATGKPGQFELADGGTLFLDEIAELPASSQVKLLRFLEDGRITRLGDTRSRHLNVRVLAATHQDMEAMVEQGRFRLDLYYRLNVIPIQIPAVRERTDCIVPLIRHYLDKFSAQSKTRQRLTRAALDALTAYPYPGNVRELMNICERLVVMADSEVIDVGDLPAHIGRHAIADANTMISSLPAGLTLTEALDRIEKQLLEKARTTYRNQWEIAKALGINQSTVARKFKKHKLS